MVHREPVAGRDLLPDLGHRLQQEGARRANADLGLGEVGLHNGMVAERTHLAARNLVLCHVDEAVEAGAGDAQRHAGEAHLVAGHRRHAVERAGLAALLRGLPRDHVARDRMGGRHEMVGEGELVARRAAQADRVPDVGPRHFFALYQHGALELAAVGPESRRAVGLVDRTVCPEPGGVPAARGEGPHAGDLVAALAFDGFHPGAGAPGQHGARIVAEDRLGHGQIEIGGRHGAAAGLAQAPGGAGIGAGDGLDDMEEGDGVGLDPVRRARHQQAEQLRLVQFVQKRRRQPASVLDFIRRRLDDGT
jgi:hypothetical protein